MPREIDFVCLLPRLLLCKHAKSVTCIYTQCNSDDLNPPGNQMHCIIFRWTAWSEGLVPADQVTRLLLAVLCSAVRPSLPCPRWRTASPGLVDGRICSLSALQCVLHHTAVAILAVGKRRLALRCWKGYVRTGRWQEAAQRLRHRLTREGQAVRDQRRPTRDKSASRWSGRFAASLLQEVEVTRWPCDWRARSTRCVYFRGLAAVHYLAVPKELNSDK